MYLFKFYCFTCLFLIIFNTKTRAENIEGLRVEYIRLTDNVLIADSLPEYSWIVPCKLGSQNSYQIIVASSQDNIDKNIGDIWDSGRIISSQSTAVEHNGISLLPNSKYYWKVRLWNKKNKVTPYSSLQKFTTGNFSDNISTPNIFHIERISPVVVNKISPDRYLFDFGKDAFAGIEIYYKTLHSDTLTVRLGEALKEGRIDPRPGGTIKYCEIKLPVDPSQQIYKVPLPVDKRNTSGAAVLLPKEFDVVIPFRYCEIDNFKGDIASENVTQTALFNYFDDKTSSFTSSDTILNKIWDICKYSIKATTFAGVYVDGERERIPYEADAYINQLGHYGVDSEYAMAKQTIEYFMFHPTWPTEWLLHTTMLVYQDYYYTGDTDLIKKYYHILKYKTLMDLAREDGLISSSSEKVIDKYMQKLGFKDHKSRIRDIVDWPGSQKESGWKVARPEGERDGHEMLPINTVVNSFFYFNMVIMAELADVMGMKEDNIYFRTMSRKVKESINKKLFDTKTGIYIDGEGSTHSSIHSNMLPLAFGIVEKENIKSVAEYIKTRGMGCSVYGSQYLFEALYNAEESQYALDLMCNTTDRGWYNMIRVGSTITMEAWDMKYKPNSDWNHAWGAAPANLIPRYLWGVKPIAPGFAVVQIKPQLANLTNSSIVVPTIKGDIKCKYTRNRDSDNYTIEVPANTIGEFILSEKPSNIIYFNGKKVNTNSDRLNLRNGINNIELRR